MDMSTTSIAKKGKRKMKSQNTNGIGYLSNLSKALKFQSNPRKVSLHWSDSNVLVKVLYPITSQPKTQMENGVVNYQPNSKIRRNINSFNKMPRNIEKHKPIKNKSHAEHRNSIGSFTKVCKHTLSNKPINTNITNKFPTDINNSRNKYSTGTSFNKNSYGQIVIEVPAVSPAYERITKSTVALCEGLKSADKHYYRLLDNQSLVMSVIALAYSKVSSTHAWNRKTLQKIFTHACHLYYDVISTEKALPCLENLPSLIHLGICTMKVKLQGDFSGGIIHKNSRKPHIMSFLKGLQTFFKTKFSRVLVKYNKNTCAIWRQKGVYYLFELYPKDFRGERKGICISSLQKHHSCKSLVQSFCENVTLKGYDCIYILHPFTVVHIYEKELRNPYNSKENMYKESSSSVQWCKLVGFNDNDDQVERETLSVSRSIDGKTTKLILNKLRSNSIGSDIHHSRNTALRLTDADRNTVQSSLNKDDLLPILEFLKSHILEIYDRTVSPYTNVEDKAKTLTTSTRNLKVDSLSTIDLNSPSTSSLPQVVSEVDESAGISSSQETLINIPLIASTPKSSYPDFRPVGSDKTLVLYDGSHNAVEPSERMLKFHELEDVENIEDDHIITEDKKEAATSSTELEKSRDIGKTASEQATNLHEEIAYYWLRKPTDETGAMIYEM